MNKKILSALMAMTMTVSLCPMTAHAAPREVPFDVLRTAINPGYYFSGALIDMGVTLDAGDVDKNTFAAKARVTESDGTVQGSFGNFAWDPEKENYALDDNWAKWNILDAYVADEDGNRVDSGEYVKLDIEWGTRTEKSGASDASRYDVPATRASWYTVKPAGAWSGYHGFASVEVEISQNKNIPGVQNVKYVQDETLHDPLFSAFDLSLEVPGGGKAPFYTPDNASADNLRPLIVWFHGTGERYAVADGVDNPGGNLVGNRALSFADEEFQSALGGAYVLAPQSTAAGWSGNRLNDMEALINQVVADNYIDPDRIYVGGLSMGTGMTTPLITSTTENSIPFAAAMLVSGGNLNAEQSKIIADKGFPVYLIGSTSDGAARGLPTAYDNLIAAGVDAKIKIYPAGPVFDGEYYYGAHDAWNYVYNNVVRDDKGQTIFEWIADQTNGDALRISTDAHLVKKGDYFPVKVGFRREVKSNTAVLNFEFDTSKFEYRSYDAAENISVISIEPNENGVKVIVMVPDYKATSYGQIVLSAKEDTDLQVADNEIVLNAEYVVLNELDEKEVRIATASTSFITDDGKPGTGVDGEVTLIDLSNLIDLFGTDNSDPQWGTHRRFDFNNNGQIDISDIATLAMQMK